MDSKRFHAYPGRWQSPHKGHRYIIDQNLAAGKPVLILIRPMETDERNPFTPQEVEIMLRVAFAKEIAEGMVETQILKVDVQDFNRGRGAAFNFVELEGQVPDHVKRISATEIRRQIRAGEDGWRDMVMDGVEEYLEAKFNG